MVTWDGDDMALEQDAIIDIKESQVRFFGGRGKMLLPSVGTVEAMLRKIPAQKIITTDLLSKKLADQFEVRGACPVTTKKALQAIAHTIDPQAPYWRVVKKNGELMNYFPGGVKSHAALLAQEGVAIDSNGKKPKVAAIKDNLVRFD
jgi:hypothetical protein